MERMNSGDEKIIFGTILNDLYIGLMKSGRAQWAKGGENKKRFQYCTDLSGQEINFLRALQGHSGRNLIHPSITGQCTHYGRFLRVHLSRWMCNQFTLHHKIHD